MRRYSVGVSPVTLRKADVNELVSLKPTSSPISVTDSLRFASKLLARSMRLLVRYRCGGTPNDCLKAREKWYGLSCASSANDDSEMSSARCSSMYCVTFFCCLLGGPPRMHDTVGKTLSFSRMSSYANAMLCASTWVLWLGAELSTCALSLSAVSQRSRSKKKSRGRNSISAKRSSHCSNELRGSKYRKLPRDKARGFCQP